MSEPTKTEFLLKLASADEATRLRFIAILASKHFTPAVIQHARAAMAQHQADQKSAVDDGGGDGGGDIFKTCAYCNNDANWNYPGGDLARWIYCGPLGNGCMS